MKIFATNMRRHLPLGVMSIRFQKHGCANRPFYHIVVMKKGLEMHDPPLEQLGTYDPMPNVYQEKIVSFNFERLRYWIGYGSLVSPPVRELLGLCGFTSIHPNTYRTAWQNQRKEKEKKKEKVKVEPQSSSIKIKICYVIKNSKLRFCVFTLYTERIVDIMGRNFRNQTK
uniref:Small ribosomal subunit protein bS16m n=1 Tax=Strigamia maritima TaxID=126957 RepID=T1IWT3_STRMM